MMCCWYSAACITRYSNPLHIMVWLILTQRDLHSICDWCMDMGCRTYMRVALCSPLQPISYHYQLQGGRTCSSARIRNLATTVIFASLLVSGERASPGCTSSRTTKQAHAILGIQTTWYHIPLYFCRLGREWVVPSTPRGRRVSKSTGINYWRVSFRVDSLLTSDNAKRRSTCLRCQSLQDYQ